MEELLEESSAPWDSEMRLAQYEQEMAINKTEWDQIKILMRDALTEHSKGKVQQFKSWSPLGAMIAIGVFALLQWNGYTIFRTHTEDRLGTIEASILASRAERKPELLNEILAKQVKSASEAQSKLATASSVLAYAQQANVKAKDEELKGVGEKILTIKSEYPTLPVAWRATSDLINYRSDIGDAARHSFDNLPNCGKQPAGIRFGGGLGLTVAYVYRDCVAQLEDAKEAREFFLQGVRFEHCRY